MMTNKRVPENGRYGIEPTELKGTSFGRSFTNKDVAGEIRELIDFLIKRKQGWRWFTASEYHDWILRRRRELQGPSRKAM